MPKAFKICPKSNKSPNLVTLQSLSIVLEFSATRWLDNFFNIRPFTLVKICPKPLLIFHVLLHSIAFCLNIFVLFSFHFFIFLHWSSVIEINKMAQYTFAAISIKWLQRPFLLNFFLVIFMTISLNVSLTKMWTSGGNEMMKMDWKMQHQSR